MPKFSKIIAWSVIIMNLPILYFTIAIIVEDGGTWGFAWMFFPITLGCNTFLIPAILTLLFKRIEQSVFAIFFNISGLIIASYIVIVFTYEQFN